MATFKTRARALDMLGRQQIAGRPTAISELFKNAHDAYADRVEVDFYRSDGLFVLRDDGLGMTKEDFLDRWLTLGTESKINAMYGLRPPPVDPDKEPRPVLGEKGIGRLAIATLGPQVMILSRAKRCDKLHDLVAAFINWSLFEIPGIDLENIIIPVETFRGGTLPSSDDIDDMVGIVRENLESLRSEVDKNVFKRILNELDNFNVDPPEIEKYLKDLHLTGKGHGTHFIILPADESLTVDIDKNKDSRDNAPSLLKMLVGFTNTITPGHAPPKIKASFRDHKTESLCDNIIEEGEFFTREEFENTDHHISGVFDKYGRFSGTVRVFGEDPVEHSIPWPEAHGKPVQCGPFKINIAVLQGESKNSRVDPEEWLRLAGKLNRIGGLYIYKDGIRVLPYGGTDYDFIDIEKNRTKSAGYYYFSYRRMIGTIEVSQEKNSNLNEKAGREGFRENKAYRQFRDILMNFFLHMVADFFRESGTYADTWIERKEELERLELARRKREKMVSVKRKIFQSNMDNFFKLLEEESPQKKIDELLSRIAVNLNFALTIENPDEAARTFMRLEVGARYRLEELKNSFKVAKPKGVGLSKQKRKEWNVCKSEFERIDKEYFAKAVEKIDKMVGDLAEKTRLAVDMKRRFQLAIEERFKSSNEIKNRDQKKTKETIEKIREKVRNLVRESIVDIDRTLRDVESEMSALNISAMSKEEMIKHRNRLENKISSITESKSELLEHVREQLNSIDLTPDKQDRLIGIRDVEEALDEELLSLREQVDENLELAQLGMAIGVIQHEFNSTVQLLRKNIRTIGAWARVNPKLKSTYKDIRTNFEHLDGYLTMFAPLSRRITREKTEIKCSEIVKFLERLFGDRMERHKVKLEATNKFKEKKIVGYPSTFYPVFVNLIDNSLFWLREQNGPRRIFLDADNISLMVSDTGPGVSPRDRESIFDMGFTRKPGGRGMGLHIARSALRRERFDLELVPSKKKSGALFKIKLTNVSRN